MIWYLKIKQKINNHVALKHTENIVGSSGNVNPLICNIFCVCDYVNVKQSDDHNFADGKATYRLSVHCFTFPQHGSQFCATVSEQKTLYSITEA
jgi:hypothetical protein